jgi:enoyl-CoA hydratase
MLGATIPAGRALELGLATEVVADGEALAAAHQLAQRLMTLAPLAVVMAKVVLNTCTDVDAETGRRLERLAQSTLKVTDDHAEGARASAEKSPPRWTGR